MELRGILSVDSLKSSGPALVTRDHKMLIKSETIPHCLPRKTFYSNRLAFAWNSLPGCCIESVSINKFKANIGNGA